MNITKTVYKTEKVSFKNHFLVGNFKLIPKYQKQVTKINDIEYETKLFITITSTPEQPFPIDLEVVFSGVFTFGQIEKEDNIDSFLNIGAIQIMIPLIRTIVSSVTASSMIQPLILPLVDARQFVDM